MRRSHLALLVLVSWSLLATVSAAQTVKVQPVTPVRVTPIVTPTVVIVVPSVPVTPMVVGADGVYLGKLTANPYAADSIANRYGAYGSPYSPTSINNPYGRYGSVYSPYSATNPYATSPPIVVSPTPLSLIVRPR